LKQSVIVSISLALLCVPLAAETCTMICRYTWWNGQLIYDCEVRCPSPPPPDNTPPHDEPLPNPGGPCGADLAHIQVNYYRMSPSGSSQTVTNPTLGIWGNEFHLGAEVKKAGSSTVYFKISHTPSFNSWQHSDWLRQTTISNSFMTSSPGRDGSFQCNVQAQIECDGEIRLLAGQSKETSLKYSGHYFNRIFQSGPYETGHRIYDGRKSNCYQTVYTIQRTTTFTHSITGSINLAAVLAAYGMQQSVSISSGQSITVPDSAKVDVWIKEMAVEQRIERFLHDWLGNPLPPDEWGTLYEKGINIHVEEYETCP